MTAIHVQIYSRICPGRCQWCNLFVCESRYAASEGADFAICHPIAKSPLQWPANPLVAAIMVPQKCSQFRVKDCILLGRGSNIDTIKQGVPIHGIRYIITIIQTILRLSVHGLSDGVQQHLLVFYAMCQRVEVYDGESSGHVFSPRWLQKDVDGCQSDEQHGIHNGKEGGRDHRRQHVWVVLYSHQFFFYLVKPDKTGQVLGFEMTGYCIMDHLF